MLHLFGLVMLVGGIGLLDLRLLGAWPALDLRALARAVSPIAATGVLLLAGSGAVMFAADAAAMAASDMFRLKLILILLAAVNALLFRILFRRPMLFGAVKPGMRAMAAVSLGAWVAVLVAGRMIAYS
ncbi:MAG: hypothetical protein ACK4MX_12275 [Thermaurantiacus sp.]